MNNPAPNSSAHSSLPVTHPENFPVASWLCPPHLRNAIAALYAFARAADDIADEGDHPAETRLKALANFRNALWRQPGSEKFEPQIFMPLQAVIEEKQLPVQLLDDLLKAFEQDIQASASGYQSQNLNELLTYCERSANPVGRLLLHLYGVQDDSALARSDAICSALQLINFWQDLSEDIPRGRYYLPQEMQAHMPPDELIQALCRHALHLMRKGTPLIHQIPGRAGWELRLVVQGGLRILEKVQKLGPRVLKTRPQLKFWDFPVMLWRALWMSSRQCDNLNP